jgi:outer membrane protein TolC
MSRSIFARACLSVSLAALLSGCASLTGGSASDGALSTVSALEADIPADLPFDVPAQGVSQIAELFDDLLLQEYLGRAVAENTDLAISRSRLEASEFRLKQAQARRSPFVTAGGSVGGATALSDIDLSDNGSVNLGVGYDPDIFGELRAGVRGANAREALQRAETARLRRVIQARTAQAYIQVIASDMQLALARENFSFLGETLRVSRARFEAGDIARADFALSEAEQENARANLEAQEFAARQSRRALATLINTYADEALPVSDMLPDIVAPGLGLPDSAGRHVLARQDVAAARLGVLSAAYNVDAVRASTLPSFSLGGGLNGGFAIEDLFDIDTYIASLTASISDTLFNGGFDEARIAESRTTVDAALSAYEASVREAYREILSTYDEADVFRTRVAALDRASEAASTALRLENIRFDLGEAILLDVLTVQRRVNAIQSSRISAESGYLQTAVEAVLATGSTFNPSDPAF